MRFRAAVLSALLLAFLALPASAAAKPWIGVEGSRLVDRSGAPVRLLGVNVPGPESQCVEAGRIFLGPTDWSSVRALKSWHVNVVRLPLNESCWLGINGVDPALSGSTYREAIRAYVKELERGGFYVILDLQWAAPGRHQATGLIPLPDAEHAPDFWRSVGAEFSRDRSLLFDLFNEPHDVGWECWSAPCTVFDHWFGNYPATGLPQLLEALRGTGARQPVLLGGLDWAGNLEGWLEHVPADPAHAIVAANHTYYETSPCYSSCRAELVHIAAKYPVVTSELGEMDCRRHYVTPYMRWADAHGISYLGWSWAAGPGWGCGEGPSLISDYSGKPTRFGAGFKRHFSALARKAP
jgi:hypothetical protein